VIEENKIGKEVLDGGNGGKPVLSGPLRANARRESRAIAKKDLSLGQRLARCLPLDPITTKGDQ
jgi:hypothetical protein